jgi:WD40 repeat protein
LKVLGLIDSDKAPSADIAAKSDTGTLTLDLKALKLSPGDYGCILQGTAKMKVSRGTDELALAEKNAARAAAKLDAAKRDTDNVDALKKSKSQRATQGRRVSRLFPTDSPSSHRGGEAMRGTVCIAIVAFSSAPVRGALVEYEKSLLPVLKDNCIPCHNKTTTKAGLNMETPELMLKGGDTDVGIVIGDGAKSLIYQAAANEWDSEMPPKSNKVGAVALTAQELDLLKRWIDEGAVHAEAQEKVIAWEPLPAGLQAIYAVSITPDGQFAAAARSNQISIYHLPTQSLVTKLTDPSLIDSGLYAQSGVAHQDLVPAIAFSPDGMRLATGSYREVKLWKRMPSKARSTVPATATKLSIDAGKAPDVVSLIDQPSGKRLRDFKHGAKITAFALAADSQRLVTAGEDRRLKIWETATGKLLLEIKGTLESAQAVLAKTRDNTQAGVESAWLAEKIAETQKEVTDFEARSKKAQQLAETSRKDLDPKRKASAAKAKAQTDAENESKKVADELSQQPKDKPNAALAKKLEDAKAKAEKAAKDAKTAKQALMRVEATIAESAKEIEFLKKEIAATQTKLSKLKAEAESAKKAAEVAKAAEAKAIEAHESAMPKLVAVSFSTNGLEVQAESHDGQTIAWSPATGRPMVPGATQSKWVLERKLGSGDGKSPITDRVASLAFAPDRKLLAVGSGQPSRSGDITLWETSNGKLKSDLAEMHLDTVLSLAFSPNGQELACGGADKALRVLDPTTGKVLKVFEGHTHHVLGVGWRADGRLLASAGADNSVKIWDWTTRDRRKDATGWDKEVTALRYLGGGDVFATTSGDAKVRLLNSNGAEVKSLPGATDFMNAVAASHSGEWIVGGGQDGTLHIWQASSGKQVAALK